MRHLVPILFISISFSLHSQIQLEETTVDSSTIIYGLDIPWEIQWGPDNWIWTTERFGRVSRINPVTGEQVIILDIQDKVLQSGESGLLGMVLHPDFDVTPYVYLAYTYQGTSIKERIVRYEYNDSELADEVILLDNIRGSYNHDGCRLIISPDLKLYITTGDALVQPASQDIDDLSGKVLRITLDGSVPEDNPFSGNPVWSYGHRNAQGLFLSDGGILYSSEHGPSTDDEFNIIEKGRNYGWPNVHGFCNLPDEITFCNQNNVREPLVAWTPTVATSDIILYDHPSIPEWQGSILMTTLKNKRIYELELDESGTVVTGQNQYFINLWGRLRDICTDPDGAVYLATNGPDWSNNHPFTHRIVKIWNSEYTGLESVAKFRIDESFIYPNPAYESFTIKSNPGSSITITDLAGRIVYTGINEDGKLNVNTDTFTEGYYLVAVSGDNYQYVKKLVIID